MRASYGSIVNFLDSLPLVSRKWTLFRALDEVSPRSNLSPANEGSAGQIDERVGYVPPATSSLEGGVSCQTSRFPLLFLVFTGRSMFLISN